MGSKREYQVCTLCVMDTSDPDITFDENGVCNYDLQYLQEIKPIVDAANSGKRQDELDVLVAEIKAAGKNKPYDCVIGVSGGVDSTYLLYRAVQFGLRPLAVHFDSGWNSQIAAANIENLVTKLGVDLVTDVVNWSEMRDLQLSFLKASVPNCDIPTDHAFTEIAYRQAVKYGIKFILSGHNLATEFILPPAWGHNAFDATHLKAIQRRFGTVKLRTYPIAGLFKRHIWYGGIHGIRSIRLLNYIPYIKKDVKELISSELGWQDYGGKHYESVFTRYFQGYYLPTKFGFDKRRAHLSSLIVSGQLEREEALKQLEEPLYEPSLLMQDHTFIAKKLGISTKELETIIGNRPIAHLEYPNSLKRWRKLGPRAQRIGGILRAVRRIFRTGKLRATA